jgi:hypothetical protein
VDGVRLAQRQKKGGGNEREASEYRERQAMNDARLWHPWLRINRVLRVMLHTRWSAEAWLVVRVEFRRALAVRSEIRRAGWFN